MASAAAGAVTGAIEATAAWLEAGLTGDDRAVTVMHPAQRGEDPPGVNVYCLAAEFSTAHGLTGEANRSGVDVLLLISAHGEPAQMLDRLLLQFSDPRCEPGFMLRSATLAEWASIWAMLGCAHRPALLVQVRPSGTVHR